MAHTVLSLGMNLISQATKDNVPTFSSGLFSNDMSRILIDGYNDKGVMVHPMPVLLAWTQWDDNPASTIQTLLDDAIEYTAAEFTALKNDVDSIWYVEKKEPDL